MWEKEDWVSTTSCLGEPRHLQLALPHQVFLRDATSVAPLALLLYGGGVKVHRSGANYVLFMEEGWIRFRTPDRALAELVVEASHSATAGWFHFWAGQGHCGLIFIAPFPAAPPGT